MKNILTSLVLIGSLNAWAVTQDNVTLPDVETVQGQPLVLNGMGFRKATFLKLKVYAAGLYLEKKSHNSDEIVNSKGFKKVVMKFLRNVSADDVKGAWEKSFKNLCDAQCDSIQADIQKLKDAMEDVKAGDVVTYSFSSDHMEVVLRDKKVLLPAGLLAQLVLKTWVGPHPPNSELKEGLLGL